MVTPFNPFFKTSREVVFWKLLERTVHCCLGKYKRSVNIFKTSSALLFLWCCQYVKTNSVFEIKCESFQWTHERENPIIYKQREISSKIEYRDIMISILLYTRCECNVWKWRMVYLLNSLGTFFKKLSNSR